MKAPQFKKGSIGILNEKKIPLYAMRETSFFSVVGLSLSKALLFIGIILILLNNLNVIAPGSYFGAFNSVTMVVFSIGIFINFISIPYLYFSSFKNFKKENDFWDREIFWIMPLFFFGTFFIYGSQISSAFTLFIISILTIASVHLRFIYLSQGNADKKLGKDGASYYQYSVTVKYLTLYYFLLLLLLLTCNPLQHLFVWVRTNM